MKNFNFTYNLFLTLILTSCSSTRVWTISNNKDSGKVAANKKLAKYGHEISNKIPCKNYQITKIDKKDRITEEVNHYFLASSPNTSGTGSALHDPIIPTSGSAQKAGTPLFHHKKEIWFEYSYKCLKKVMPKA